MTLFDTNVVIDALYDDEVHHGWATREIAKAAEASGANINVVTIAEIAAGTRQRHDIQFDLAAWQIRILDLPVAAGEVCGKAYRRYLGMRRQSGGGVAPRIPLPDFFIGAHAEVMGWKLATRDVERYAAYFPNVPLIHP